MDRAAAFPAFVAAPIAAPLYVWATLRGLAMVRQSIVRHSPAISWLGAGDSLFLHLVAFTAIGWLFVAANARSRARRPRPRVVAVRAACC